MTTASSRQLEANSESREQRYPDSGADGRVHVPGPDGPISMVNLLKFKEKAAYKDGRETELTGQEAYALYSRGVMKTLATVGGKLVFSGDVSRLMLGEVEDLWDTVAIAQYPSRARCWR